MLCGHGHSDHRQIGPRGDHAGKMRGAACGCDHDFEPTFACGSRPLHHAFCVAMCGANLELVRQFELVEHYDARLHQRQIGAGAEDDADDRLHYTASRAISERKKAPWNRTCRAPASALSRASATVSPSATDVTTLPPSVTSPRPGSNFVAAWKIWTPLGISARPWIGNPVFTSASSG